MKKLTLKVKIAVVILLLVLIAGVTMIFTMGFNFDLKYADSNNVQLYIEKDFEISDIKQITDEVLPGQDVIIQKVEVYADTVSITAKEITEDQKNDLVSKINEKYGTEIKSESTNILTVPHVKGMDLLNPYITPFAIATGIILLYLIVRYYKLSIWKVLLKSIGIIVLAEAELVSIMAITRIPIGRLTIPLVLTVYMLTFVGITTKFEKDLKKKKEENN